MIGPLLNLCKKSFGFANTMSTAIPFKRNFFGSGTASVRLAAGTTMTNAGLYNSYHTLEFKDLTIDRYATLTIPKDNINYWDATVSPTQWHPLYLKCSDTLTVNGSLSAVGLGGSTYIYEDRNMVSPVWSPVPIEVGWQGYGCSTRSSTYYRLLEYGRTATFFDFDINQVAKEYTGTVRNVNGNYVQRNYLFDVSRYSAPQMKAPLFLVGGGGGGNLHYSTGSGPFKDWHNEHCS